MASLKSLKEISYDQPSSNLLQILVNRIKSLKKSLSVTKYTQPEPEAKKICQNFTLNSSVDRLQHDEAGNWITD